MIQQRGLPRRASTAPEITSAPPQQRQFDLFITGSTARQPVARYPVDMAMGADIASGGRKRRVECSDYYRIACRFIIAYRQGCAPD